MLLKQSALSDKDVIDTLIPKIRAHEAPLFNTSAAIKTMLIDIENNRQAYFFSDFRSSRRSARPETEAALIDALHEEYVNLGGKDEGWDFIAR